MFAGQRRKRPDDWSQGIPLAYVQEVADYWLNSYDMNRLADRLNAFPHFTTTLDGVRSSFSARAFV